MQNPIKKLDKALLFSRNQIFCLKVWKLRQAPTPLDLNIFCWDLAHVSYLPMSTKGCSGFFILFRSWVICKNLKDLVSTHLSFTFLLITPDLNKIENSEHPFVDIVK